MGDEGILLRHTQRLKELELQLNDTEFAQTFGDIKFVFDDGEIYFYKSLLTRMSPIWADLLRDSEGSNLVLLEKTKKVHFLQSIAAGGGTEFPSTYDDENQDIKIEIEDEYYQEKETPNHTALSLKIDALEEKSQVINTVDTDSTKSVTVLGKVPELLLEGSKPDLTSFSCIISNFSWPSHLSGPNYHSIRWGMNRSTEVLEVMGNRSIFTVLAEQHMDFLPCVTEFTVKCSGVEDEEVSGTFYLKDFVNSGANKDAAVFKIAKGEKEISLVELLKFVGYEKHLSEGCLVEKAAENINIIINGKYEKLNILVSAWKAGIIKDTYEKDMKSTQNLDKEVMKWLRGEAQKTVDGGEVCCYCGFVCYEQSLRGNFLVHMQKHLYRKKECSKCKIRYLPFISHTCSVKRKHESLPCRECGTLLGNRTSLLRHLKRAHSIIEKVIVLRECSFCSEKVEDLSGHYMQFHKNEQMSCQFCGKAFLNPTKFKCHVDLKHKRINKGFCAICEKEFNNLLRHNRQCHNKKTYPCEHCEKVFKHKATLNDHMSSVNGTRVKKPCPECGNFYVNLYEHIRRFHRGVKKTRNTRYCTNCRERFDKDNYEDHRISCKLKKTVCYICSKNVVQISTHLTRFHEIYDRKCHLCGNSYQTTIILNKHLRDEHFPKIIKEELRVFSLDTEDAFQREAIATKLVESFSVKSSDGPSEQIECSFCKYRTSTKINMVVHMKDHLGFTFRKGKSSNPEKERVCPDCGKLVKYGMKMHMKKCKVLPEMPNDHSYASQERL